jgi:hypothetical protein
MSTQDPEAPVREVATIYRPTEEEIVQRSIATSTDHLEQARRRLWANHQLTETMQLVEEWSIESVHLTALMEKTWNHLAADLPEFYVTPSGEVTKAAAMEEAVALEKSIDSVLEDLQFVYNTLGKRGRQILQVLEKRLETVGELG